MNRQHAMLWLVAVAACDQVSDVEDVEQIEAEINGGTSTSSTTHRREIGLINAITDGSGFGTGTGCTGTLIGSRWVLTAAHCTSFMDSIDDATVLSSRFFTSIDGQRWGALGCGASGCQNIEIERSFNFHGDIAFGSGDVALLRLSAPVPSGFATPTSIATAEPTTGGQTIWGGGCDSAGGSSGRMRFREALVGDTTTAICPGDSGGPRVIGFRGANGPIYGVNSAFSPDLFGAPVMFRSQISAIMSDWNANGANDISANNWCTHSTARLHYVDIDSDQEPDAICHDVSTGWRWVANGTNRLIREVFAHTNNFCGGSNRTLYTGDFNGDSRTDLLCRHTSGLIEIDYHSVGGFHYAGAEWSLSTPWCTHASARLHVGDFNGDGRSDLLCHDVGDGRKWIDYADTSGRFAGASDWTAGTTASYCSHVGAQLYVGEFNGDGRSDLFCHTASTGAIDVQFSDGGSGPFQGTPDQSLYTPRVGWGCATTSECQSGEVCESGQCRDYFCRQASSVLTIADYSNDGISDVMCTYTDGRTSGQFTWGGFQSHPDNTMAFRWAGSHPFGWAGTVRLRTIRAAAQPWSRKL